jgi:hypothetical protein
MDASEKYGDGSPQERKMLEHATNLAVEAEMVELALDGEQ